MSLKLVVSILSQLENQFKTCQTEEEIKQVSLLALQAQIQRHNQEINTLQEQHKQAITNAKTHEWVSFGTLLYDGCSNWLLVVWFYSVAAAKTNPDTIVVGTQRIVPRVANNCTGKLATRKCVAARNES
jgi:hypothetical protein